MPSASPDVDNSRGILFMIAACTGFIVNDMFVKLASADIPIPQIIVLRGLIATPLVVLVAWRLGAFRQPRLLTNRFVWLRTLGEVGATGLYLSALARMDIANSTAIMQLTPLAVTAVAAMTGEPVGLRRWSAIIVGFLAVLLVIRPGMEGFTGWSLLALLSVGFVTLRDITSRMIPGSLHPLGVSAVSLGGLVVLGLAMSPLEPWQPVTTAALVYCAASAALLSASFVFIILAMRDGEVSVVSPFRYTILLWAIVIQIVVFAVWPDRLTLIGSAILVCTGLYTLYRERKRRGSAAANAAPAPAAPPPPRG